MHINVIETFYLWKRAKKYNTAHSTKQKINCSLCFYENVKISDLNIQREKKLYNLKRKSAFL